MREPPNPKIEPVRLHYGVFRLLAILTGLAGLVQLPLGNFVDAALLIALAGLLAYVWHRRRAQARAAGHVGGETGGPRET